MADTSSMLVEQIDESVRHHLYETAKIPEEAEVRATYEQFYDAFSSIPCYTQDASKLDRDTVIDQLVDKYCRELSVRKDFGFTYKDDICKPWLKDNEDKIAERSGWFYWKRYKRYLLVDKKWAPAAVRSIEQDTWNILDLMGNPMEERPFERRGLVVASVQSGKTANYTGLICRAADAGYKIIIVMAGVYNVLRNQTQARLEDGFTGFNIVGKDIEPVGVGIPNQAQQQPIACTSREADFNKRRANALKGIQTANTNAPWLFVIKKNSNSLKQVYEWLKDNANPSDQLLLIDDEADNASINGKYKREEIDNEPTRINGQIRRILNYFSKKCYVGYTATPFANILINPTVDTDKYGKDLFPSSFIYTLQESSDYFGAAKVFEDIDEPKPSHLRFIDDINLVLPPKHKSNFKPDHLPESLKEAIRTFIIATAIRALRGDANAHSTMMVNVSPYKTPQKTIANLVDLELDWLRDQITSFAALPESQALQQQGISLLHETWLEEYPDDFSWDEIQAQLYDTIKDMHVVSINSDSNQNLEYDLHTEHVIAVGGYRLSRGLTLEGLVVSYYSRNAKAYDALMQMARWFGYRPGYEDLCRIWMSEQSAGWYQFVAESTDDLFDDLRTMRRAHRTPKDYGLKIRQSPDSLIVTARNKMGTGTRVTAPIDLNGSFIETVAFDRLPQAIQENKRLTSDFVASLAGMEDSGWAQGKYLYRHVPVSFVIGFLEDYWNEDARSPQSQKTPVLNYIDERRIDGELEEWDVYIAEGSGHEMSLGNSVSVHQEIRYPGRNTTNDCLVVGEKQRLASRGVEKIGLSDEQVAEAESDFKAEHPDKKNTSDRYYRIHRTDPLLVIHPVLMRYTPAQKKARTEGGATGPEAGGWPSWDHEEEAYGWSISFPHTSRGAKPVNFIFNQVAIDNIKADYEEDSDDDYEDE